MKDLVAHQQSQQQPSAGLSALLDAVRGSVPVSRRDLTPGLVSEARSLAAGSVQPAPPEVVVSWLKRLAVLVVNAPEVGQARGQAEAMLEICGELAAGVWCPETRKAWCQQGERGKFWPAPAELYAHLLPYSQRIHRDILAARRVVALAERAAQPRATVDAEERAAVAAQMAAWRAQHPDAEPERRRPEVHQPSAAERIAGYRQQIEADPASAVWLMPLITQLQTQTCGKNDHSSPHSTMKPIGSYVGAGNHQRAL